MIARSEKQKPGFLLVCVIFLVLFCVALFLNGCASTGSAALEKGPFSGMVNAPEVDVTTKIPGRVVKLLVREGDSVAQGQLVAEIDSTDLRAKEKAALAAVEAAGAAMQKAKAGMEAAEAAAAKARAALGAVSESADAALAKAQAALEKAREDASLAGQTYKRIEVLYQNGAATAQQLDETKNKLAAANAALEAARADLAAAKAQKDQVNVYRAELAAAMAARAAAEADLNSARAAYQRAKAELQEVRANLLETQLRAPMAGTVTSRNVEQGEMVSTGMPLLTITARDRNWVDVKVPETMLGKISLKKEVTVTSAAFPGKKFKGKVTAINKKADFATYRATNERGDKDIMAFNVKLSLNNPSLWPGMMVEVNFE